MQTCQIYSNLLNHIFFLKTDGVPLSLTYFIQYDTAFGSTKQTNTKSSETKFIRTCAKKQVGQGKKLYFCWNIIEMQILFLIKI